MAAFVQANAANHHQRHAWHFIYSNIFKLNHIRVFRHRSINRSQHRHAESDWIEFGDFDCRIFLDNFAEPRRHRDSSSDKQSFDQRRTCDHEARRDSGMRHIRSIDKLHFQQRSAYGLR
jgi:hypothetical protein